MQVVVESEHHQQQMLKMNRVIHQHFVLLGERTLHYIIDK